MTRPLWIANRELLARTVRLGIAGYSTDPIPPAPVDDATKLALERAQYDADVAKAEAAKMKAQLDEMKKLLPTEEQRAKYAELEEKQRLAEEERLKKEGDFHAWRTQITETNEKTLQAERELRLNAEAKAKKTDGELDDTLIAREFADASDLFGPSAKTVLMPDIAQAYFKDSVEVQTEEIGGRSKRRVVVKDTHGAVIVDEKTGKPKAFAAAMQQLIDSHPRREHMLRGSGKSGSGSLGGHNGVTGELDTSRLKPADFQNPEVQAALKKQMSNAGGMQIAPGYDRFINKK